MIFNPYQMDQSTSDIAYNILYKKLRDYGSSLTPAMEIAFKALFKAFNDGFKGYLPPKFHLSSIDTGLGKSLAVRSFLKALKILNRLDIGGIIICLQTKAEIKSFIKDCELDGVDFAVLVSNDDLNKEGRGDNGRGDAPVLFTTQNMLRSRAGISFLSAKDFHYKGQPRALRIWDESMLLATTVTLTVDMLDSLKRPLRPSNGLFVTELESFLGNVRLTAVNDTILMPERVADLAKGILLGNGGGLAQLDNKQRAGLKNLTQVGNEEVRITESKRGGLALSGIIAPYRMTWHLRLYWMRPVG